VSQDLLFLTGVNILMAWSVYIILLSGSLSFANGGFMALGAYAAGVFTMKWGMNFYAALALAGAGAAFVGALLAYPALRTRGVYLILVTIGLSFIIQTLIQNTDYVGGVRGMTGMTGTTNWHVWGLIAIVGVGLFWLSRSHLQRQLDAVREDERVAASLGIDVVYLKIVCFAVGAALAFEAWAQMAAQRQVRRPPRPHPRCHCHCPRPRLQAAAPALAQRRAAQSSVTSNRGRSGSAAAH
jgi:branched-chain amino acid transport system permease protein